MPLFDSIIKHKLKFCNKFPGIYAQITGICQEYKLSEIRKRADVENGPHLWGWQKIGRLAKKLFDHFKQSPF